MCGRREGRLPDEAPARGPPISEQFTNPYHLTPRTNCFDIAHAFYRSVKKARIVFQDVSTYCYSDGITICQSRFTAITFLSSSLFSCTSLRSDGNLKRPFFDVWEGFTGRSSQGLLFDGEKASFEFSTALFGISRLLIAGGTSISTHISAASSTLGISFGLRKILGSRDIALERSREHGQKTLKGVWMSKNKDGGLLAIYYYMTCQSNTTFIYVTAHLRIARQLPTNECVLPETSL